MKYIKQLDSLRAIAVVLVIISHWIPANYMINRIPNGAIGVDMFFVLSGFLITRILFNSRNKAELLHTPTSKLVKNFYIRRTLRIFPIYYLVIFLLLIFHQSTGTNIQSAFLYFATYTSNFYFYRIQGWEGMLSHLWSLAVEEQFYLIWPWIILFLNKKYFLPVILCFIGIGIVSQIIMSDVPISTVLTFTCFDAFGLGALLSWQLTFKPHTLKRFYAGLSIGTVLILALYIFGITHNQWAFIPIRTAVSVGALWLITYIIVSLGTGKLRFKFIFNNSVLIFLGKISYGLYLYHNIIPEALNSKIINVYINPLLPDILYKKYWGELFLVENAILLVLISWLSYKYIEKPFLNLKKHFE